MLARSNHNVDRRNTRPERGSGRRVRGVGGSGSRISQTPTCHLHCINTDLAHLLCPDAPGYGLCDFQLDCTDGSVSVHRVVLLARGLEKQAASPLLINATVADASCVVQYLYSSRLPKQQDDQLYDWAAVLRCCVALGVNDLGSAVCRKYLGLISPEFEHLKQRTETTMKQLALVPPSRSLVGVFNNLEAADVTIQLPGNQLRASKSVLVARSAYFESLVCRSHDLCVCV